MEWIRTTAAHQTGSSSDNRPCRLTFLQAIEVPVRLSFSKLICGQAVYACNATYGGVVFAYASGPIAVLHFSPRAVGIDELSRPQLHQLLDLR